MKRLYLDVPLPCHADWAAMQPNAQGRHCLECNKDVVDFSGMSDADILNFFTKAKGETCGRFAGDQLRRAIVPPAAPARKRLWVLMLSVFVSWFGWSKVNAQKGKVAVAAQAPRSSLIIGDTTDIKQSTIQISGRITDDTGMPLEAVSISAKGSMAISDSLGRYSLPVFADATSIKVFALGYHAYEVSLGTLRANQVATDDVNIILTQDVKLLEDVVVVGMSTKRMYTSLGGAISIISYERSFTERIVDTIIPTSFKVFPNPAQRGNRVYLEVRNNGEYSVTLSDNMGRPLLQRRIVQQSKGQAHPLDLPATIAAGTYTVSIVERNQKKVTAQRIIIQ